MNRNPLVAIAAILFAAAAIAGIVARNALAEGNIYLRGSVAAAEKAAQVPTILAFIFLGAALVAVILAVAAKPATTEPASMEPAQT